MLQAQPATLDVRAPAEFQQGAVPGAVNLPILDDDERRQVGIAYKQHGAQAASELGHRLVSGALKDARIEAWIDFIGAHDGVALTCWRGGQRSAIAQQWLHEAGHEVARVDGGYKALRKACLSTLSDPSDKQWWVLAGRTGSSKTVIINQLDNSIDLEGHANHRGSAFGAFTSPQPAPASFENGLAFAWHRHTTQTLVVEDESRTIGRVALPEAWHAAMQRAPLVLVETTLQDRVEHIFNEYVHTPLRHGTSAHELCGHYRAALARIRRRLGRHRAGTTPTRSARRLGYAISATE